MEAESMNRRATAESDFQNLVWDYLDGDISPEEFGELTDYLRDSLENVRKFLWLTLVDQQATEAFQEKSFTPDILLSMGLLSDLGDPQLASCSTWQEDQPARDSGQSNRAARLFGSRLFTGAIAASLTALAFFLSGMLKWPGDPAAIASLGQDPTATEVVQAGESLLNEDTTVERSTAATITGMLDAKWKSEENAGSYGEPLQEGRLLSLEEGFVQVTFESGAKVLVQGPADFQIHDDMRAVLESGKIAALCPRRAHGFSLRTPAAEVIDLGTEFALQVNDMGVSEIHVFDGEVITQALDGNGDLTGDLIHVTEHMAVRYTPESTGASTIRFNGRKFRRELEPLLTEDELPSLPLKKDLALWLAADQMVKLDEEDRVIAWRDIQTGDNQTAEDALQHMAELRPVWVENTIGGKPSLRFDGRSYLITTPLETTDNQTVSLVFSIDDKAVRRTDDGGQILSYNGPPSRELKSASEPGVLQIGDFRAEHWGDSSKHYSNFSGFVYSMGGGRPINSGMARTKPFPVDTPIVLTYVYSRDDRKSKMFVNGTLVETNSASVPCAFTSRKVIGRHGKREAYFIGNLAEVLIYNSALSEKERRQLDRYLLNRYLIPKGVPVVPEKQNESTELASDSLAT